MEEGSPHAWSAYYVWVPPGSPPSPCEIKVIVTISQLRKLKFSHPEELSQNPSWLLGVWWVVKH